MLLALFYAIGEMGGIITSLRGDINIGEVMARFAGPIAGMSMGFGSSLFGVAAALILSIKGYILNRNQEMLIEDVQDWMNSIIVDSGGVNEEGMSTGGSTISGVMDVFTQKMGEFSHNAKDCVLDFDDIVRMLTIVGSLFGGTLATQRRHAKEKENLVELKTYYKQEILNEHKFENIIGNSTKMQQLFSMLQTVSPSDATILIRGETGTGKELIATAQDMQKIKTEGYFVGKAWSVGDVLKEIHKALHENSEAHYKITDNDKLIPQEFLLFENSGSDDLSDFVDSDFSKARITLKLPWMEAGEYEAISQQIESLLHERLGDDVKIQITGMVPLFGRTLAAAMDSMALSYAIAFGLIAFMMVLLLGSLKIGLLSMVPNILPAIMTLGFMSMVGMPLDMFTMLVGAIVIGLSVDDTVHYFYNFSKYHHQGYSVRESAQKTMLGTGRALVATTIVLSLGFYVYTFASLSNLINFGILAGGAITLALISNVLLGPALLKLTTKEKK